MKYELLHLKQFFPNLGTQSGDPLVKVYLPDNLTEMGRGGERRPCLIVCPGGAYEFCSQREAEPIAFHFLPEGFNVFVLLYSVAPHHYPAQQCEAAALIELINQNADIWHCDTGRIVLMGFSAGGHLAAAADALRDEMLPFMGILTLKSQRSETRRLMPSPSLPMTMAAALLRSAL